MRGKMTLKNCFNAHDTCATLSDSHVLVALKRWNGPKTMQQTAGAIAILFYLASIVLQATGMRRDKRRSIMLGCGFIAASAHATSAFALLHAPGGWHFGLVEISTLISAVISLLVLFSSLRKPLDNLFLALFPLAILSIAVSMNISSQFPPTQLDSGSASHVLLSILAYSVITIAALQALLLAYQNNRLKHHHPGGLLSKLPPLQDMEALLFELLWAGQLLLSTAIVAGFLFFDNIWGIDGVIHKTFFSLLAWTVFAALLWGRSSLGWRGVTAIRFTLSGFALLILGFYGSKFALEYLIR
jgi:ABC-type uncharacterized transport system permease subunit